MPTEGGAGARARPGLTNLAAGTLWGVVVWALETADYASAALGSSGGPKVLLVLLTMWVTRGIALAWAGRWLAQRLRPRQAWLGFALLSVALAVAWDGFEPVGQLSQRLLGTELPNRTHFLYTLWIMFVYGTALFAWCLLAEHTWRTRAVLARAEAARGQGASDLLAAQAEALARRVDPALLLRALEAARAALPAQPDRAQGVLEDLVVFLRAALPGLRGANSTLGGEVALVRAYAQLLRRLEPGRPAIQVSGEPMPADPAFPALLLPLVEAARAGALAGSMPVALSLTTGKGCAKLRVDAAVARGWLPGALEHRLRLQLDALHGQTWRIEFEGGSAFELTLPLADTCMTSTG